MKKTTIAIAGSSGRMGKMLLEAVLRADDFELVAALDQPGSEIEGRTVGEWVGLPCSIAIETDLDAALAKADCLIDFTRPAATLAHAAACCRHGTSMVIGTTGFDDEARSAIEKAAATIPIVMAPNMAVGVNLVFKLLESAAAILAEGYDIEIVEAHHRHKVDAPSGTSLRMGQIVAQTLGRDLADCAIYGRQGFTGERDAKTIAFSTIRGGDIVGDHTVMFCGEGERVEITHKAGNRWPYALGSLRAARFLAQRKNGLYDMQDVLGLRSTNKPV